MSRNEEGGATRLIQGVGQFQKSVFGEKESLFRELGEGQSPAVMFITCSDSRIDPNLLTLAEPGELFILRNAGNIIPPHDSNQLGEAATIEYAVRQLKVRDIVLCGHSKCGAMGGVLAPEGLDSLPKVREWLAYATGVAAEVAARGSGLSPAERLSLAVERNVLKQIDNLRTHPSVAEAVSAHSVRLHAWVYHFETGTVTAHDATTGTFVPVAEAFRPRPK